MITPKVCCQLELWSLHRAQSTERRVRKQLYKRNSTNSMLSYGFMMRTEIWMTSELGICIICKRFRLTQDRSLTHTHGEKVVKLVRLRMNKVIRVEFHDRWRICHADNPQSDVAPIFCRFIRRIFRFWLFEGRNQFDLCALAVCVCVCWERINRMSEQWNIIYLIVGFIWSNNMLFDCVGSGQWWCYAICIRNRLQCESDKRTDADYCFMHSIRLYLVFELRYVWCDGGRTTSYHLPAHCNEVERTMTMIV